MEAMALPDLGPDLGHAVMVKGRWTSAKAETDLPFPYWLSSTVFTLWQGRVGRGKARFFAVRTVSDPRSRAGVEEEGT